MNNPRRWGRRLTPFLLASLLAGAAGCHLIFRYEDEPVRDGPPAPDLGPPDFAPPDLTQDLAPPDLTQDLALADLGPDSTPDLPLPDLPLPDLPLPDLTPPDLTPPPDLAPPPVCGNGTVEKGEQCDYPVAALMNMPDWPCRTNCQGPTCGDGIIDSGEECDYKTGGVGCTACKLNKASLLTPDLPALHFGAHGQGCSKTGPAKILLLKNMGPSTIKVKAVSLSGCPPAVQLTAGQPVPFTVSPKNSSQVFVVLGLGTKQRVSCVLAIQADDGDLLIPITGAVVDAKLHTDHFIPRSDRMVDLAVIVDNGGTMAGENINIGKDATSLVKAIMNQNPELHLGFFSMAYRSTTGDGVLYGSPPYLTRKDLAASTAEAKLQAGYNMTKGTFDWSTGLMMLSKGFLQDVTATVRQTCSAACPAGSTCRDGACRRTNHGFRRPGAHLEIIVATDADDIAVGGYNLYLNRLQSRTNPLLGALLRVHTLLPTSACWTKAIPATGAWPMMVKKTGGTTRDLCASSYVINHRELFTAALKPQDMFRLTRPVASGVASSITGVQVGGKKLMPSAWQWDAAARTVTLSSTPGDDKLVEIAYKAACN